MGWKHTITLKDLLTGEETDANAQKVAVAIHTRLKADPWFAAFGKDQFLKVQYVSQLNYALDRLYDYADAHKIWVA